jgi:hypothetical protein
MRTDVWCKENYAARVKKIMPQRPESSIGVAGDSAINKVCRGFLFHAGLRLGLAEGNIRSIRPALREPHQA